MMVLKGGFFTSTVIPARVIDIGGEPFHAAAVALIDSWKNTSRAPTHALEKVISAFDQFYPQWAHTEKSSVAERMEMLFKNLRKSVLVECMAFILRQLTVDELYVRPVYYQMAFYGFKPDTPKSHLRQMHTRLPSAAFAALAQTLALNIRLSFKEPGLEIRKYTDYFCGDGRHLIEIQVQGESYFPRVQFEKDFSTIGQSAIKAPMPVTIAVEEGTLAGVVELIHADNKCFYQSCSQWRNNILRMLAAKEVSLAQLEELYIKLLPAYTDRQPPMQKGIAGPPLPAEQQKMELLASTLAQGICSGQIPADYLQDMPSITTIQSLKKAQGFKYP